MGRWIPGPSALPGYVAGTTLPLDRRGRWPQYVEVAVYRDARSMRKALTLMCCRPRFFANAEAAAHRWTLRNYPRHRGIVVFHRGQIGSGIVAHEMTHAADFYVRGFRRFKPSTRDGEESLAESVGVLVNAFWRWYYKNERDITGRKQKKR